MYNQPKDFLSGFWICVWKADYQSGLLLHRRKELWSHRQNILCLVLQNPTPKIFKPRVAAFQTDSRILGTGARGRFKVTRSLVGKVLCAFSLKTELDSSCCFSFYRHTYVLPFCWPTYNCEVCSIKLDYYLYSIVLWVILYCLLNS